MFLKHDPNQNHLLAALSPEVQGRLFPYLELVQLPGVGERRPALFTRTRHWRSISLVCTKNPSATTWAPTSTTTDT